MDLSPAGAAFVRVEEGVELKFYLDSVGVGTIGIGFTWGSAAFRQWWADNKPGMTFGIGATMTRNEAEKALIYCFANEYGKAVNAFLGHEVPQNVFDGMASPVYNLGTGSLGWKWAAFAKRGDYSACAAVLRSTGTTAKGKTLAGLVRRRREEAALIESGIYAGVGKIQAATDDPVDTAMLDSVLTRGERGPSVAALVSNLAALGYYKGKLDDVFGYGTEAAVLAFQRDHGLTADGYAGEITLAAITAALAAPKPPQTPPIGGPSQQPAAPARSMGSGKVAAAAGIGALIYVAVISWWHEITRFVSNLF
ncbi:glycoside hydrolase family protein [Mesorhizobium japonicum]|uniref:Lysozyme n=1 Tax=Mesorhizobium japonicum (strain LMG 29417 / CECT 9101 / MAFF 303099) TaxID=266835 RepID=Q98MT9_RHILO|nr:peptidoglycan-binding protein [Mesorhizobium japonicum]BAB48024.1 mll0441 [Mesorhizobium japonicum MAFF 303099]